MTQTRSNTLKQFVLLEFVDHFVVLELKALTLSFALIWSEGENKNLCGFSQSTWKNCL